MTQLIGLGGLKESGKDQVANHLVATRGWAKIGMSDVLAQGLLTINPAIPDPHKYFPAQFSPEEHWVPYNEFLIRVGSYEAAKRHRDVRILLLNMGTKFGRNMVDENMWVAMTERAILPLLASGQSVAVTGIRFHNELNMVLRNGGATYWVERPLITQRHLDAVAAGDHTATDVSEVTLTRVDFQLQLLNDLEGDLVNGLYREVDLVIQAGV